MKTKTYKIEKLPGNILEWLNNEYPQSKGYKLSSFYWYKGTTGERGYGCYVHYKNNLWSNPQLSENDLLPQTNNF